MAYRQVDVPMSWEVGAEGMDTQVLLVLPQLAQKNHGVAVGF